MFAVVDEERHGVALSSLDSPLGDGLEVAKRALVDHFDAVADRLVPLLAEAAHPDDDPEQPPGLHLTGRQAAQHAAAAGVGRLLLTHVPAWVDHIGQLFAASSVFSETELVRPGGVYDI